jgi:para-aminobenzoate synthetase component 1
MHPLILEVPWPVCPEALVERMRGVPGVVLLRSGLFDSPRSRYSLLTARPFVTLKSWGSHCEVSSGAQTRAFFGNPWRLLETLLDRYELPDTVDLPFPLGGAFGFWGYELKHFVEPKLSRRAVDDLGLPECHVGFYSSLVVFDHHLQKTWIVSTGMTPGGNCSAAKASAEIEAWQSWCGSSAGVRDHSASVAPSTPLPRSNLTRQHFVRLVERARSYIRSGDIYQVNLSHRLAVPYPGSGWDLFGRLTAVSPAPFAAYLDGGNFQIASSSPELFLRISGTQIQTCPIKGTRPRGQDATQDAQLAYALKTSAKEMAELVMITDLLRNDLGRISQFGSVHVTDLARLERFSQVQHLVSTIEGRLHPGISQLSALSACFPGGSVTGAPKFRAMEIIDELEPVARGPYTGALGYLGFNRESQCSILIRAAIVKDRTVYFHVGAGIVADSDPDSEYAETLHKAAGFFRALAVDPVGPVGAGTPAEIRVAVQAALAAKSPGSS